MSEWKDISRMVWEGMKVYSPQEGYSYIQQKTFEKDGHNVSFINMGCHCGTHMDAPAHFLGDGVTIETVDPDLLIGRARVATLDSEEALPNLAGAERLLLRLKVPGISPAQARTLAASGVRLLGVDDLSVAVPEVITEVHRIILGAGIWIVESLALEEIPDGEYDLVCAPLKLQGREGAPARAFVRPVKA